MRYDARRGKPYGRHSMSDGTSCNAARLSVRGPYAGHGFAVAAFGGPADPTRAAESAYVEVAAWLTKHRLTVLHERLFGSRDVAPAALAARRRTLDRAGLESDGPVTFVAGRPAWSGRLAGVVVHAVQVSQDASVVGLRDAQGRSCGRRWSCRDLDWVVLQDLPTEMADNPNASAEEWAQRAIEQADSLLLTEGLSYRNVVRTWFYLDGIASWYDRFNAIRHARYEAFGLMPRADGSALRLPASTGIGASAGRPVSLDVLAVAPRTARAAVTQLSNPAQMDAFAYGSAFSRGALVRTPGLTLMELSGTASIDERGRTMHPHDFDRQVGAMFDRLERLLEGVGTRPADACAATAFVKRPEDVPRFRRMLDARGLSQLPVVCIVADICREELVFELDAELMWCM